jgi:hypothetical protein
MRSSEQSIPPVPPPPIDLSRTTEATRRQIYDAIVQIHFTVAPGEILAAKRAEEWYQKHTADECGVTVLYILGRWIAYWRVWEEVEEDAPESHQWEVVRVESHPSAPYGIDFSEV